VTLNDRIDYFGRDVNIAYEVSPTSTNLHQFNGDGGAGRW